MKFINTFIFNIKKRAIIVGELFFPKIIFKIVFWFLGFFTIFMILFHFFFVIENKNNVTFYIEANELILGFKKFPEANPLSIPELNRHAEVIVQDFNLRKKNINLSNSSLNNQFVSELSLYQMRDSYGIQIQYVSDTDDLEFIDGFVESLNTWIDEILRLNFVVENINIISKSESSKDLVKFISELDVETMDFDPSAVHNIISNATESKAFVSYFKDIVKDGKWLKLNEPSIEIVNISYTNKEIFQIFILAILSLLMSMYIEVRKHYTLKQIH